jgi:hypothetical protein
VRDTDDRRPGDGDAHERRGEGSPMDSRSVPDYHDSM